MELIAVTNDRMSINELIQTLVMIDPYIDKVILREKSKPDSDILQLIQILKNNNFDAKKIIVHGRPEIAASENIEHVQLPGSSLPLQELREKFPTLSFGKSVHSLEEAKFAASEGAASLLYGHLYETNSKLGLQPRGTDEIYQIASSLQIPVYGIGGIQPNHIEQLKELAISGVAVMSSIFTSDNPQEAAKSYYDAIHS